MEYENIKLKDSTGRKPYPHSHNTRIKKSAKDQHFSQHKTFQEQVGWGPEENTLLLEHRLCKMVTKTGSRIYCTLLKCWWSKEHNNSYFICKIGKLVSLYLMELLWGSYDIARANTCDGGHCRVSSRISRMKWVPGAILSLQHMASKPSAWASNPTSQCIQVPKSSAIARHTSERSIDSRADGTLPGLWGVQLERSVDATWWRSRCQNKNLGSALQEVPSRWKFWSKEAFSKLCIKKIQ